MVVLISSQTDPSDVRRDSGQVEPSAACQMFAHLEEPPTKVFFTRLNPAVRCLELTDEWEVTADLLVPVG